MTQFLFLNPQYEQAYAGHSYDKDYAYDFYESSDYDFGASIYMIKYSSVVYDLLKPINLILMI